MAWLRALAERLGWKAWLEGVAERRGCEACLEGVAARRGWKVWLEVVAGRCFRKSSIISNRPREASEQKVNFNAWISKKLDYLVLRSGKERV